MPFARPRKHFNCYIQAPHKSTMLDPVRHRKLKTLAKACGLALGEGREQNLCICLFILEIRRLRDAIIFCVLIVVPLS